MPQIYKYHWCTHIPEKLRYVLLRGWGADNGLALGHREPREGQGSGDEVLRGAAADSFRGRLHPSRPMGRADPPTGKLGVSQPGGRHPKISQWTQRVPPSAPRGKVPSHIFPEMPTPKCGSQAGGQVCARDPSPKPSHRHPKEDPRPRKLLT